MNHIKEIDELCAILQCTLNRLPEGDDLNRLTEMFEEVKGRISAKEEQTIQPITKTLPISSCEPAEKQKLN